MLLIVFVICIHFNTVLRFFTPWKQKERFSFLTFLGGKGWNLLNLSVLGFLCCQKMVHALFIFLIFNFTAIFSQNWRFGGCNILSQTKFLGLFWNFQGLLSGVKSIKWIPQFVFFLFIAMAATKTFFSFFFVTLEILYSFYADY